MTVQPDSFVASERAHVDFFGAHHDSLRFGNFYRKAGKRILDLVLVLLAAPVIVPVVLVLAAITASDGCNPFYSQRRIGRDGRVFTLWKIRTMVQDADAALQNHLDRNDEARREWNEKQKLCEDPRITPVGAVIRKTSLDELPQLWNVLVGDMSLVGPRPMMPQQRALYPGISYYYMRPGVSGFWQISDRNNTSFAARARFDDSYHKSISLKTDLRVIFSTVMVVLRGTGC